MSTYLIALVDPNSAAWQLLREKWPDQHHVLSDRLAFVSPSDTSTPDDVEEAIGLEVGPNAPSGIIIEMTGTRGSGILPKATIQWLNAAERE